MGPELVVAQPVYLLTTQGVKFLGDLAQFLGLQGLDLTLELFYEFLHRFNRGILGCHVIGLLSHLRFEVHIGVTEVSHCRPVFCCCLLKVCKGLFDPHQIFGPIAAMSRGLLPLSEVGL